MARRGRPRKKKEITIKSDETKNVIGILSMIVAALLFLSYFVDSPGFDHIRNYLGNSTIVGFFFFGNLALRMFRVEYYLTKSLSLVGQFLLIFTVAGFMHYFADPELALELAEIGSYGGMLGYVITYTYLIDIFASLGALVILISLLLIAASLSFGFSISDFVKLISKGISSLVESIKSMNARLKEQEDEKAKEKEEREEFEKQNQMISDLQKPYESKQEPVSQASLQDSEEDALEKESPQVKPKVKMEEDVLEGALVSQSLNYAKWKYPPTSLLSPPEKKKGDDINVKKNADIIEQTLQSFGVKTRVVDVLVGPSVTQYALNIALGTKVSRISNLKTDLALALAAPTGSVRIEAPIPGTSYIGIEIPNVVRQTVNIRELMESDTRN